MGTLNAAANLFLDVVFAHWLGLEGLALATSAVNVVVAWVFWVRLRTSAARRRAVEARA